MNDKEKPNIDKTNKNSDKKIQKEELSINSDINIKKESKSNLNYSKDLKKEEINNSGKLIKDKELNISKEKSDPDKLEDERNKYYVPICKETDCGGYLHFYFHYKYKNFFINGHCEKNKNHKFENLYYETFEKFYLKEKFIQKCSNCSQSLENNDKYKCNECDKLYCSSCFLSDLHIQKDWKKLEIITNKCLKHKKELTYYCLDCKQKICPFCFKKFNVKETNPHKNHKIKNILDAMPSLYRINALKEKILKKEEAYNILFKSLDEWQVELKKRVERIKQNLRTEIRVLKKFFFNFNQEYIDYNYYLGCSSFFKDIKDYNNKQLKDFMDTSSFNRKTESIFDLICPNKKEPENITTELEFLDEIGENGILDNLNEKFLLLYTSKDLENSIKLISIDYFKDTYKLNLTESIKSLTISSDNKKIYACLENKKEVLIINFDPEKNTLKLSDEKIEINDGTENNFNKCIPINDNETITIDNDYIYLWNKTDLHSNYFLITQEELFCDNIYDVCKITDKCLLFSHCKRLTFFSIEDLKVEKIIENIDCIKNKNEKNLILIKDCVLVNCLKGIAIISIRTKEMIQYIENWENFEKKKIYKSTDDYIYISNSLNDLFEFSFDEYYLKLIEKIIITDPDGETRKKSYDSFSESIYHENNIHLDNYNIVINNVRLFIFDHSIYITKLIE